MIYVTISQAKGSTPRERGASMQVSLHETTGTIGGGALEYEAISHARAMLLKGESEDEREFILGPHLGQCCGGVVELAFSDNKLEDKRFLQPLYLFGLGHTGKALKLALTPLPFALFAHDERDGDNLEAIIKTAPMHAIYLIMTHSHALDYALAEQILRGKNPRYCGMIGSDTKRVRFISFFKQKGGNDAQLGKFHCPIGIKTNDKSPEVIAALTAADLLVKNLAKVAVSH